MLAINKQTMISVLKIMISVLFHQKSSIVSAWSERDNKYLYILERRFHLSPARYQEKYVSQVVRG